MAQATPEPEHEPESEAEPVPQPQPRAEQPAPKPAAPEGGEFSAMSMTDQLAQLQQRLDNLSQNMLMRQEQLLRTHTIIQNRQGEHLRLLESRYHQEAQRVSTLAPKYFP